MSLLKFRFIDPAICKYFLTQNSVIFKSKIPAMKPLTVTGIRTLIFCLSFPLIFNCISCNGDRSSGKSGQISPVLSGSSSKPDIDDEPNPVYSILVLPKAPVPGEPFRVIVTGGKNIGEAAIIVEGPADKPEALKSKNGDQLPYWRIDDFPGCAAGKFKVTLSVDSKEVSQLDFEISAVQNSSSAKVVWKTLRWWNSSAEAIYSAWINALFQGCDENSSWKTLNEVTQNPERNFLFNYLSLGEDDPDGKNKVIMRPDCADNPFYLRAYFSWKLGLPFGFHLCDRGYLGRNPGTGLWITNETFTSKTHPVLAFNNFLRRVADGVHSGTARTALDNGNSDYYPVPLKREALLPGTVYADPYGHTLILVGWVQQTRDRPGLLLSVDAQPDGTVGIKRFWKGNFLFNTEDVVGEPGFKAFRPIIEKKGVSQLMSNNELTVDAGYVPFSLQQRKMESDVFYHTMERLINPEPLNPETALLDLLQALHEQLLVRVTSVANGEAYFVSHPGAVIPMPSRAAGIFQAGGQWEDFSTPNRDLRLLIAMDAVLDFPEHILRFPEDFNISKLTSPQQISKKLQAILAEKSSELPISYTRTDGSVMKLSVAEILNRREAFEMAYNPNDGIEIRWGAPENSEERSSCRRHAPAYQMETMRSVRTWFSKRLHPPT